VDVDGKQVTFRTTVVRPYHYDDSTVIPPYNSNEDHNEEEGENLDNDDYMPEPEPEQPRRKRGRPKGSKNKPKQLHGQLHTDTDNVYLA
jgi:hypothetical protein